eukprot:Seg7357.1 transcript_id=Seg7357.1/GoldUCD/mRNA.D3Y31 product="hypothetical protein" protein_id=Seg7357.1/GoldUCD/D3Y31
MGEKCAHYLNCSSDIVQFFRNQTSFSGGRVICEREKSAWTNNCEITGWIHATLAIIAILCAVITFAKYNSIRILNLNIHIDAISNTWWMFFYAIAGSRSILNSVKWATSEKKTSQAFVVADWSVQVLEVLVLCFALNYQRKYRSAAHINDEIDSYSKSGSGRKANVISFKRGVQKALASSGTVLCTFAICTWATIVCFFVLLNQSNTQKARSFGIFWIYVGLSCLLHLTAVFLSIVIMRKGSSEGPSWLMKILLFCGVLLTIPGDIPVVVWNHCIFDCTTSSSCNLRYLDYVKDYFLYFPLFGNAVRIFKIEAGVSVGNAE